MRTSAEFGAVVRTGRRTGRPTLVLHTDLEPTAGGVRVGFVVSKAVGNAVVRNRVKRRLRHLVAARLEEPIPGLRVVVRALPAAGQIVPPDRLAHDLAGAWTAARRAGWVRG